MRKWLLVPCLILTAAAIGLYPLLSHFYFTQQAAPPPGIRPKENRLVRIWLIGDCVGADGYLKKQAAAYEKAHTGVRLYLRAAQASELADPQAVLPDGVIFAPGAIPEPERLLTPLAGAWPMADSLLMAGKWQGEQYALPLLLGGYALAASDQGESSLQCAPGIPLLLAGALGLPADGLPATFAQVSQPQVYQDFTARRCRQAVLTLRQIRSFQALVEKGKGFAYTALAFPTGYTDLCLAGGIMGENAGEALAFLQFLLTPQSQQALADYGLFSVDPSLSLYDGTTPLLDEAEAFFSRAAALPSLFAYDAVKADALARGVFFQGADPASAFEQLQ